MYNMTSDTVYVFGDQSVELLPAIRQLSRQSRHCPALKQFMRVATDSIQQAVLRVPTHLRPRIQPFETPLQLAEAIDHTSGCTPFTSSLLSIVQLGSFIVYVQLS